MDFISPAHEKFYRDTITTEKAEADVNRRTLFYVLGLTAETRRHITDLYDFNHHLLKEEGLKKGWQTEVSVKACRLAFNLFNGCGGMDSRDALLYTPFFLFDCKLASYFLEAVKIRFSNNL